MTSMNNKNTGEHSSNSERKIYLLESMLASQKQIVQLLSCLNNNVEELLLDVKDIKMSYTRLDSEQQVTTMACCQQAGGFNNKYEYDELPTTPTTSYNSENVRNEDLEENSELDERLAATSTDNIISQSIVDSPTEELPSYSAYSSCDQNNNKISNLDILQAHSNIQQHVMASLFSLNNSLSSIMNQTAVEIKPSKPVKTGLREFSTYVSRAVRQEFGSNYLAMNRINELDRFVMQRIKEEAVAKFLPPGVSEQLAWNHAMNSLRQLRHRVCKKAKEAD